MLLGMKCMTKVVRIQLLLIVLAIFLIAPPSVQSVIIDNTTQFKVQNETYKAYTSINLNKIEISADYIIFNSTKFFVTSPNSITISLVNIHKDIDNANNGDKILDFYAVCSSGKVWFNLSEFPPGNGYSIKVGGTTVDSVSSNLNYYVNFSYSSWSTKRIQLYQFEKCPLWDINIDRICNLLDLILVSNKMGFTGKLREDVDKNGLVQLLDLVLVSNSYDQIW